jgi:putative DNA primase/helicase
MTAKENRPSDAEAAPEEFGGSEVQNTPGGTDRASQTTAEFDLEAGSPTQLVRVVTTRFLKDFPNVAPEAAEQVLLGMLNKEVAEANAARKGSLSPRLATYSTLPREAVARLVASLFVVRKVRPPKSADRGMLAIYQADGPDEGIYVGRPDYLRSVVRLFLPGANKREADDVLGLLREAPESLVPTVTACDARDLTPVDNGVFDYATEELLPFSPDLVLTAKVRTKWAPGAPLPIITEPDGSTWDIESGVLEMFGGNEELANAWWHVVGASVRPNVRWDQAVYFFDEDGESGKGTTVELMRGLHGDDSCSSLPIADFAASRRFRLAELEGKTLNACDENAVGDFNDDLAAFKAVITGDVINFERKMEQPYSARSNVFMVQCLNGHTKSKDTSRSARRRQYFLPFLTSFTGRANKAIKADYVRRPEVLEYVLHKVLTMPDFYVLPPTEAGEKVAAEARLVNDPVVQFWAEFADEFVWDLLPSDFLYDLYRAWFAHVNPNGRALSKIEFTRRLSSLATEMDDWEYAGTSSVRTGHRMDAPEPLIARYRLDDWMNPVYRVQGGDPNKLCLPLTKPRYRGLLRVSTQPRTITVVNGIPVDLMPPTSTPEGAG